MRTGSEIEIEEMMMINKDKNDSNDSNDSKDDPFTFDHQHQ